MSNVAISVHILCNHFFGGGGGVRAMIIMITQGGGGGGVQNWEKVDYVICACSLTGLMTNLSHCCVGEPKYSYSPVI